MILFLLFGCTKIEETSIQTNTNQQNIPDNTQSNTPNTTRTNTNSITDLENMCIDLCKTNLNRNTDLSNGPCLGLIAPDWVCDVAHNPRIEIDNLFENTCADFANGVANHFVEVNENCELIESN